jgi:hypothetical protein
MEEAMSEQERNYEEELRAILYALADSVADMSDAEIVAEVREGGDDPKASADRVRSLLLDASKSYQQRHLREAQKQYERRIAAMRERKYSLPSSPEARRSLLAAVFARKPEMQLALLTAQHREFRNLTDADIENCLKQLDELGVLDELPGAEGQGR